MISAAGHLRDLTAVLFECILIITLGYLACRFRLISSQAKDLNSYLTTFALPMIIFLNIAQMEFQTINLSFLFCMLAAKLVVFLLVTILTLTISYPTNFGYAGALSILATQSNDFALGYPLIKSLYGDTKPEMLNYLSLMAPIQLLILNPLGIMMLEFHKSKVAKRKSRLPAKNGLCNVCVRLANSNSGPMDTSSASASKHWRVPPARRTSIVEEQTYEKNGNSFKQRNTRNLTLVMPTNQLDSSLESSTDVYIRSIDNFSAIVGKRTSVGCTCEPIITTGCSIDWNFVRALASNPLIIASTSALAVNLLHGPELPKFVTRVSNTIAASFAAPALFVVGLGMYGKFQLLLSNPSDLLLSTVLVLTKILILPNFLRTIALAVLPKFTPAAEVSYLIDFSFLYGLLPTAPTACIIAKQYDILTDVVSISMLLSTFASAPLMLGAAALINPSKLVQSLESVDVLTQTVKFASILTLVLTLLTLLGLWRSKQISGASETESAVRNEVTRSERCPIKAFVYLLLVSQLLVGLGGIFWYFNEPTAQVQVNQPNATNLLLPDNITEFNGLDAVTEPPPTLEQATRIQTEWSLPEQLGLRLLHRAQYTVSSMGLMSARYLVLCILLTLAGSRFMGTLEAWAVSSSLKQVQVFLSGAILVWLLFDSGHIRFLAAEAALPSNVASMLVRLVYNSIFIFASVPIFALIIRANNRDKMHALKRASDEALENEAASAFAKRHFVTSSVSLSSDTSSASTANTNLELNSTASHFVVPTHSNAIGQQLTLNQTVGDIQTIDYKPARPTPSPYGPSNLSSNHCESRVTDIEIDTDDNNNNNQPYVAVGAPQQRYQVDFILISEFNKYSVLIVFMLINSTLNVTTIAQKLLQEQPFGTFEQAEIISTALEFGQGLLTFLVYGARRPS